MIEIDIEGAKFRNADHDCRVNRQIITEAQGYAEDSDPIVKGAAEVYSSEYDPTAIKLPWKAYYAPHHIGSVPVEFQLCFNDDEFVFNQ